MPKGTVPDKEQREKMVAGRLEQIAVKAYLDAVEKRLARERKRGRPKSPEKMRARLDEIDGQLPVENDTVKQLLLVQERINIVRDLEDILNNEEFQELEDRFVKVASSFSDRREIEYAAWREMGVTADVLKRAGIKSG